MDNLQIIGLGFILLAVICYNAEINRLKKRVRNLEADLEHEQYLRQIFAKRIDELKSIPWVE